MRLLALLSTVILASCALHRVPCGISGSVVMDPEQPLKPPSKIVATVTCKVA